MTDKNTLQQRRDKMVAVDTYVRGKIPALQRVAAKGIDVERMAGAFAWALAQTPAIAETPPETVLNSLMISSQVGLYPGPEGDCFLIPRWNGKTRRVETQWQPGYPGLLKLAWRSGAIASTRGYVVREADKFDFELGLEPHLYHKPLDDGSGEMVAVYFIIHLNTGAPPIFEVMTRSQIEEFRDQFAPKNKAKQIVGPWVTNFEAMALKTVCIRALKFTPKGDQLATAIQMDSLSESGLSQPVVIDVGNGVEKESPARRASSDSKRAGPADESSSEMDSEEPSVGGVSDSSAGNPDLDSEQPVCGNQLKGAPEGFGCGLEPGHDGECLP